MKMYYNFTFACMMFTSVVVLTSCSSSDDELPADVIEDSSGIKIDLDWTTGGTVNDALNDADLDLRVYKNGVRVLSSASGFQFERITFDPDLYADGTYTVVVYLYQVQTDVSYTATINGITISKPYDFTSFFGAGDESHEVEAVLITKKGNRYTMRPVE